MEIKLYLKSQKIIKKFKKTIDFNGTSCYNIITVKETQNKQRRLINGTGNITANYI